MFSSRTPDGMLEAPLFDRFFLDPEPDAASAESPERRAERSSFASPSEVAAAEEDGEVVRRQWIGDGRRWRREGRDGDGRKGAWGWREERRSLAERTSMVAMELSGVLCSPSPGFGCGGREATQTRERGVYG
jgi:hypothetical protein